MYLFCSDKIIPVSRLTTDKRRAKMIKTVIRCPSDMVIVLDKKGEQLPEYQGQYEGVKERILQDAPINAVFGYLSDSEPELRKVLREEW